jgi:acyl-CoA thioesterase
MTYQDIVYKGMYDKDAFSKWLAIEIEQLDLGYCKCSMTIREEMTNGFGMAHGGITYALADSAFAFASNSRGRHAVSIETSIAHTKSLFAGMKITAEAKEIFRSNKLGNYDVQVFHEEKIVALFKGTVFIKETTWTHDQIFSS